MAAARFSGVVKTLFSRKYLLYTNTAICVCLYPLGDSLSQVLEYFIGNGTSSPQHVAQRFRQQPEPTALQLEMYQKVRGFTQCSYAATTRPDHLSSGFESALHEGFPGRGPLRALPRFPAAGPVTSDDDLESSKKFTYDYRRSRVVGEVGLFAGPFLHCFYDWLDKFLTGKGTTIVIKKIIFDQIICSPVTDGLFLFGVPFFEGEGVKESWLQLKTHFGPVYLLDFVYWPIAQAVNFAFLPTRLRVLYVAASQCIWNAILSFYVYRNRQSEESAETETNDEIPIAC